MGYINNNTRNSHYKEQTFIPTSINNSKSILLYLGVIAFLALSGSENSVQGATIQSRINTKNFTNDFSAEWYVYDNQDGTDQKIRMTLRLKNVNTRDWVTNNQDGIWMGVGLGETVMSGSDIVMCTFRFSDYSNNDIFQCTDRYASAWQEPPIDQLDTVTTVDTQKLYNSNLNTATLAAVFERALTSSDSANDYIIEAGKTFDAIWAWGEITSGTVQYHGDVSTKKRDSFSMRVTSPYSHASYQFGLMGLIATTILALLY
eukprot:403337614